MDRLRTIKEFERYMQDNKDKTEQELADELYENCNRRSVRFMDIVDLMRTFKEFGGV